MVVGSVDDPAEAEADQLADATVAAIASRGPNLRSSEDSARGIRRSATDRQPQAAGRGVPARRIRRSVIGATGGAVDADTESRIHGAGGMGRTLDPEVQRDFGAAMGADLSNVRVHAGAESRELNDRLQAKAFTVGRDIHFRDGLPDTSTPAGQHLLAHEVAHTLQQGAAARRSMIVRRLPARTLVETELRKPHATEADKIDESTGGKSRAKAKVGQELEVNEAVVRTDSESNEYVQTKKVGSKRLKRYVKRSAIEIQGDQGTGKESSSVAGNVAGKIGDAAGILPDINDAQDGFKISGGTVDSNMESGMGVAAGAGDTVSMFTGLAEAIVSWREAENGSDKAGAVLTGIGAVGTGAKGISGMADKGGAGDAATAAAQGIAGFTDAFLGIKDTFFAIKHIVELVQEADKLNDKEKFSKSMEIITEAMSAAKSGVSSAKAFMDLWGGGAGAPLVNAVPGFGIALAAVDIIIRAVDLVDSQIHRARMQEIKRANKVSLGGKKGKSFKAEAEQILADVEAKRAQPGAVITDEEEERAEMARDYLMSKGLQYISQKRTNRAILKISVAMGKMAGDIAVLGGASAPVGVGIKAGAMALDVGASGFRKFKQWGRDKAAAGSTGRFFGMFNKNKSSAAKMAGYNNMVDKTFDMIIKATKIADDDMRSAAEDQVAAFVGAMGMSVKQMNSMKSDPGKLRNAMIKAMQKRE